MHRRDQLRPAGGPGVARKVHGVFVAIDLDRLGAGVVLVGPRAEAARVAGPHVPLGAAVDHPLGQHLAGAACLGDAEGEDAALEGVFDARHRADQRVAVRGVRDRAVDDAAEARLGEHGDAGDGVLEIPFQPLEVVGEELEGEVVRDRVVRRGPAGAAVALVRAEVEAVLLLAEVVGGVDVAQERQLAALGLRPLLHGRHGVEHDVLVLHRHRGHLAAEEPADLAGAVAGGVDDVLTADRALAGLDHPFAALAAHPGDRAEADDGLAEVAGALGQRLGELGRVDVAVMGVVEAAGEVVGLEEGITRLQIVRRADLDLHALVAAHALDALELLHARAGMGEADRAGDMVVDRVVHRLRQPAVELGGVALHVHDRPGGGEGRHVARRVPGGAGGELVALEEHAVGPASEREMVECRAAHGAAADDHHAGRRG